MSQRASGAARAIALSAVVVAAYVGASCSGEGPTQPQLAVISVSIGTTTLQVGQTVSASAILRDATGAQLSGMTVTWLSSNSAVVAVSSSGAITAVAPGSAQVTATSQGVSGSATVDVIPVPVASVHVTLDHASITAVDSAHAVAATLDAAGHELAGRSVQWSSSDTTVATVSTTGTIAAVAQGTAVISAASEGNTGSATLTVRPAPVAAVSVTLASPSLLIGQATQATATLLDARKAPLHDRQVTWSVTPQGIATVSATGMVTAVGEGVATVTATSEGLSGNATLVIAPVPVAAIEVSVQPSTVIAGFTAQATATLHDSAGGVLTGRAVEWISGDAKIATVSASGVVTAVAVGSTTIGARREGRSASAVITVIPVPVATVSVTLAAPAITAVGSTRATATLHDARGNVLEGRTILWAISDSTVANVAQDGTIGGLRAGTAMVSATSEGQTGSATLTVTPAPVASVAVVLAPAAVTAGHSSQASATLRDQRGGVLTNRAVTWRSDNDAVATISGAGVVTSHSAGTALISASSEGISGSATLAVSPAPVASVSVSLAQSTVSLGDTTHATAITRDAANVALTGRSVSWASDNRAVADVSPTGVVTTSGVGTAAITATSEGKSGSAVLTVIPAPVARVTVVLSATDIWASQTSQATATLHDARGGLLTGRAVTWTSDNAAVATVTADGLVTSHSAGHASITATSEGQSGAAALTVAPAPVATIAVSLGATSITAVDSTTAAATLRDPNGNLLTGRAITWMSSADSVATISAGGGITAARAGSTTITATSDGRSGSATLTVTAAAVAAVTVVLAPAAVTAGQVSQGTVTLRDRRGGALAGRVVVWRSDNDAVATVSDGGVVATHSAGTAIITATSEGVSGAATLTVAVAPVASVSVSLAKGTLALGDTTRASAVTRDGGNAVLTGRVVSWSSDKGAVAQVSASGLVTTTGVGTATITATSEGKSGNATLTVTPAPVAIVEVALGAASLTAVGATQATAVLRDGRGNVLTGRAITWSTSDAAVATVSASGAVSAVHEGTATITATSEGRSGSAVLTVTSAPVASVVVTLTPASVWAGQTTQAAATLHDARGTVLTGRTVAWTSDNTAVATVSADGVVTSHGAGLANIRGTSEGQSGAAVLTVTAAPVATVSVALVAANITAVDSTSATATLRDPNGNVLTGRAITWSSSADTVATIIATGSVSALRAGVTTISAVSEGKTGSAVLTVTPAPVASVTVALAPAAVTAGQTSQGAATLRDRRGGVLAGRAVAWQSDNAIVATVSATGLITTHAAGSVTITATSEGVRGTATLTVAPPPVASVSVSLDRATVPLGDTTHASATTRDSANAVLTGRAVTWAVDNGAVASVSASGAVTTTGVGMATVTATSEGKSGSATLSVIPAPVATIDVALAATSVTAVGSTQATATLRDARGTVLSGRTIAWTSSDPSIATIAASGSVSAVREGVVSIVASSEGKTGSAVLTVTPAPVATVGVALSATSVWASQTSQATATLHDARGRLLTGRLVSWSSDNAAAATVSTDGVVTSHSAGVANISATSEGQSGSATLTVTPAPVATVSVSLTASSITAVDSTTATATIRDPNGIVLTGRAVQWSSSADTVAAVSPNGVVAAMRAGTTTISATSEGHSGSATLTVAPAPVASVSVALAPAAVSARDVSQATATLRDRRGDLLANRTVTWRSDNDAIATVSVSGMVSTHAAGAATITATSEGVSGSAVLSVAPPPVASVSVTLAQSTVPLGDTTHATAVARDASSAVLTGRAVTWAVDNGAVASVSASGAVTTTGVGMATVTATSEGKSGSATLTVIPAPVATIQVTLAAMTITAVGATQATATLRDARGNVLNGRSLVWTSSDPLIATIAADGAVSAIHEGTATITATSEGRTGAAILTVTPAPVASVVVTITPPSIWAGQTTQLTATLRDTRGTVVTGRTVAWTSDNTAVATVSADGIVTSHAAGLANITGTSEGQSGVAALTVTPAPVATVTVSLASASITAVDSTSATASLRDPNGNLLTGRPTTWTSSADSIATVSPAGSVSAARTGTATITATSEGKTGSALLTVTPAPVATVAVSLSRTSVLVGEASQATVALADARARPLTGRTIIWATDAPGVATVSPTGAVTALAAGTATISATSEGRTGSAILTVSPVPVASVAVSLTPSQVIAGDTARATAIARDSVNNPLSGRVMRWSSSDASVATVDASGVVASVAPGSATITAASEGHNGNATLTVLPVPVASVTVTLVSSRVIAGQATRATAETRSARGTVLTGRAITWSSGDPSVATVDTAGVVRGVTPGVVSITATSEGHSGSASVTIVPVPVASVTVTLASATVIQGRTTQASAVTLDSVGHVLAGRAVTWRSDNTAVATVSSTGLVTSIIPGIAHIVAESEGSTGSATLTVVLVPVARITVALSKDTIRAGLTTTATATVFDSAGNQLLNRTVDWLSDNPNVATVSSAGIVTARFQGVAEIGATAGGVTGSRVLIVTPAPIATITVTLGSTVLDPGQPTGASAVLRDSLGNQLERRVVTWSSDNAGVATVTAAGNVTAIGPGQAHIIASSEGQSGNVLLTVSMPSISAEPAGLAPITQRSFDNVVEDGWMTTPASLPYYTVASDLTAPRSPSHVAQIRYPAGWLGGDSPGLTGRDLTTAPTTIYVSFWLKLSPNWVGHPTGTNKIIHLWISHINRVFAFADGSGSNILTPRLGLQRIAGTYDNGFGTVADAVDLRPNLPGQLDVQVVRGQWHHWEIVLTSNTNGLPNGTADWWLDGVQVGHYTGIPFVAATETRTWDYIGFDPTWGGRDGMLDQDQSMFMDHVYVSGRP